MRTPTDTAPLRVLRLTEELFRAVVDGRSNKELVDATGYSPSNVCRDLRLLEEAGWVRHEDNGRWYLTEKPVALTKIYHLHLQEVAERSRNFDMRATATARQML